MEDIRNKLRKVGASDFSVTYKLNKKEGIFGWFPYTEGFSKPFVDRMLDYYNINSNHVVLDPFSGSGTTSLACGLRGVNSIAVELNPFMDFVCKVKVNSTNLETTKLKDLLFELRCNINKGKNKKPFIPNFLYNKKFFNEKNLIQACVIKREINNLNCSQEYKDFFLLAISSLIVKISNMKRAVDLRYRNEPQSDLQVYEIFFNQASRCINDLNNSKGKKSFFKNINGDIISDKDKLKNHIGKVDFFITSPPYLNGTNYIRNTKLELGFLDFLSSDNDVKELRKKLVIAGINSTSTNNVYDLNHEFIDNLVDKVKKNAYDKRIPKMVHGYFHDMSLAIKNIHDLLKKGGRGVIVVGDSQFGGVHIETDLILGKICEKRGFIVESIDAVRKRRSKNGMELRESLIFVKK